MTAAPHELVAAEVRAELARQQLSGVKAAKALGWTQNYISVRLRGAVPFSATDLVNIANLLEVPVGSFFTMAVGVRRPGRWARLLTSSEIGRQDNRHPRNALRTAA